MSPFEWLTDLEKSRFFEDYEKRRFQGKLEVLEDGEARTFTVSLSWTDRMNQIGEIFIPAQAIKTVYSKILEVETKGFKEKKGDQIYPP